MGRWKFMIAATIVAGLAFGGAMVAQIYTGLGCALNQNIQFGSEARRLCDSDLLGVAAVLAAVLIPLAGGAISQWLRRLEPLVLAACLAAVAAFGPVVAIGDASEEAPPTPPPYEPAAPSPVISRPDPDGPPRASGPGYGVYTDDERAAQSAVSEAVQINDGVADCLRRSAYPERCGEHALGEARPTADVRVKIRSGKRWRITSRTRGVPTHTFAMDVHAIRRGAVDTVYTCSPIGTRVCPEPGRRVERFRAPR